MNPTSNVGFSREAKATARWAVPLLLIVATLMALALKRGIDFFTYPSKIILSKPELPSPNAFTDYVAAGKAIVEIKKYSGMFSVASKDKHQARFTLAQKEEMLRKNAPALKRLREGFKKDYREPPPMPSFSAMFPYYAKDRQFARLLCLESEVEAAKGDWQGAASSSLDALQMGTTIPHGSVLIGRLVGKACDAIGRRHLWMILPRLTAPQARNAARRLEIVSGKAVSVAETLQNEKAWNQAIFMEYLRHPEKLDEDSEDASASNTITKEPRDSGEERPSRLLMIQFLYRRALWCYSHYVDALIAKARGRYPDCKPETAVPHELETQILAPVLSALWAKDAEDRGKNALLMLSFALRAYRLEHRAYPEHLAQLVPSYVSKIPEDPYGRGEPLRYRREGAAYRLYSIGPDAKDDDGKPIDDPKQIKKSSNPDARYRVNDESQGDIVAGINVP